MTWKLSMPPATPILCVTDCRLMVRCAGGTLWNLRNRNILLASSPLPYSMCLCKYVFLHHLLSLLHPWTSFMTVEGIRLGNPKTNRPMSLAMVFQYYYSILLSYIFTLSNCSCCSSCRFRFAIKCSPKVTFCYSPVTDAIVWVCKCFLKCEKKKKNRCFNTCHTVLCKRLEQPLISLAFAAKELCFLVNF